LYAIEDLPIEVRVERDRDQGGNSQYGLDDELLFHGKMISQGARGGQLKILWNNNYVISESCCKTREDGLW
jgi:hypothetical protein